MKYAPKVFGRIRFVVLLAAVFGLILIIGPPGCTGGGGGPTSSGGKKVPPGCRDADGDGYYAGDACGKQVDCDDTDSTIYPGAEEHCVGIDNNCDGVIDDGCAAEVCGDGIDNDGDGVIDEECRLGSSYLSDTGQARCYNFVRAIYPCPSPGQDFYGQDACYSFISSPFTKLDGSGNALPGDALSWAMVRDNLSGLIWEVKSDEDGIHGKDNIYDWAEASAVFIARLNADRFGGYSDWRLPAIMDMTSIANYNVYNPAINLIFFSNTMNGYYWLSAALAGSENDAWAMDFYDGSVLTEDKQSRCYVRAVRGAGFFPAFTDNGDGTITITAQGKSLMWMKESSPPINNWKEALEYCANLTLAGYSDWRLPNIKELRSIVDHERIRPAINPNCFPNTNSARYWSSTTYVSHASEVWLVGFYSGLSIGVIYKDDNIIGDYFVRAVRGGQ